MPRAHASDMCALTAQVCRRKALEGVEKIEFFGREMRVDMPRKIAAIHADFGTIATKGAPFCEHCEVLQEALACGEVGRDIAIIDSMRRDAHFGKLRANLARAREARDDDFVKRVFEDCVRGQDIKP